MSESITLAAGRDGEAMEQASMTSLTTALFRNEPMWLGIPLSLQQQFKDAAKGDAGALSSLAEAMLTHTDRVGELPALAMGEVFACLAAVNGGPKEWEAYAGILARVAEAFRHNREQRHLCLWQIASINQALSTAGFEGSLQEMRRLLSELAAEGDGDAARVVDEGQEPILRRS